MYSYVFLYLICAQVLFFLTWYYTPKLTIYKDKLYNFKHKEKKLNYRLFSFLPKIKTKELYIKVLKLGVFSSVVFLITFFFNFTDTSSVYYASKETLKTMEDFERLNPFGDANSFLLIVMYLAFLIKSFTIVVSLVTLFDKILLILIHKVVSFVYSYIKKATIFCFFQIKSLFTR